MIKEYSAGAIIFYKDKNKVFYLLLRYPAGLTKKKEYWGFPKGHIEKGEKIEETAKREVKEETGLKNLEFIKGFKKEEKYFFLRNKNKIFKKVVFLLAKTDTKKVKISQEHLDFQWLSFPSALKKLTFKNAKNLLIKANEYV